MKILGGLKVAKKKMNATKSKSKQYFLENANKNMENLKFIYFEIEPLITRTLLDRLGTIERKKSLSQFSNNENFLSQIYKKEGLYRCLEKMVILTSSKSSKEKSELLYELAKIIQISSLEDAIHITKLSLSIYPSEQAYQLITDIHFKNKEYYRSAYYLGFLEYFYKKNKHKTKGVIFLQNKIKEFEVKNKFYLFEKIKDANGDKYISLESNLNVPQIDTFDNFKIDSFFLKTDYQKKNKILALYEDGGVTEVQNFFLSRRNLFSTMNISDYFIFSANSIKNLSKKDAEILVVAAFESATMSRHYKAVLEYCTDNKLFDLGTSLIKKTLTKKGLKEKESKELSKYISNSPLYAVSIKDELIVSKKLYNSYQPIKNRICYTLHNSLPYASGGYATRAHGVANGLASLGYEVYGVNRPGYPFDINKNFNVDKLELQTKVDNVVYLHRKEPRRRNLYRYDYMHNSIKVYEEYFKDLKPEVVIAASAYISAFPALIAAKKLGIPFIYEVRGFWEVTLMSRNPEYQETDKFFMMKNLETKIAEAADEVWTLTNAMKTELEERGISNNKISVIPNSCFPEKFTAQNKDLILASTLKIPSNIPVIGYIGTFVDYEGLEDLTKACGILKTRGLEFRLLLVGSENTSSIDKGPIRLLIEQYAEKYDISNWVILPGRVSHDKVESYYSLIDIAPFPRKSWPVCEMVSPMKPLEALAMKKAVVVSSVNALQEMIIDNKTGLVFDKNNTEDLANKLQKLILDKNLRIELGNNGRKWVERHRSWVVTMAEAKKTIDSLSKKN